MSDSWEYERMEIFIRDDYTCQDCGDLGGPKGDAELIVHKEESRRVTLCRSCHRSRLFSSTLEDDEEASNQGGSVLKGEETGDDETVMFFPSRREIVVDSPAKDTKRVMSQASHLVDSTSTGYMYKVDAEDVWNSPYNSFESLKEDLKSVVDSWDGGFESRIRDDWERANQFRLKTKTENGNSFSVLKAEDPSVFENVAKRKLEYNDHYVEFLSDTELRVKKGAEGSVKEVLYEEGYPVIDDRELDTGESLSIELDSSVELREYQSDWVDKFSERKSGVFVGPPGSGKTVAAIGVMASIGGETLIIVPSQELAQQWEDEIIDKTNVPKRKIGQYHGNEKRVRPITIATYDIISMSRHRKIFKDRDWGLVIVDEAHRCVSSTWRRFRNIQSKARLGLTATPVREQGDAKEIYSLVGPPLGTEWGQLFADGWVEKPDMDIIMVPWASDSERNSYKSAKGTSKMAVAASNSKKIDVINRILDDNPSKKTLIFVDWVDQGKKFSEALELPFVYGQTPHKKRQKIFDSFRSGKIKNLIISRVGDAGIDLPNAELAIVTSTLGSSRAQTGQRTGRTMRPVGGSKVYILLTKGSGEEDWGRQSTQFLAEKGIDITKKDWEDDF